jgi:hypothetical protein
LFAVAALVLVLAAPSFSPVAAIPEISVHKVTTNGDTTTKFHILISYSGQPSLECNLISGGGCTLLGISSGTFSVVETVPRGWILTNIECQTTSSSSFSFIANGVIIDYVTGDDVRCTFTNSRIPPIPLSICVTQLGVQESGGTIYWLPGYVYSGALISQCENKTDVLGEDVLGRTIMFHQFVLNGTFPEAVT